MKCIIFFLLTNTAFSQSRIGPKIDPRRPIIIDIKKSIIRGKIGNDGGLGGGSRVVGMLEPQESNQAIACQSSCFILDSNKALPVEYVSRIKYFPGTNYLDELITHDSEVIPGESVLEYRFLP